MQTRRKTMRLSVLAALCVSPLMSSCSGISDFMIVNLSSASIQVELSIKQDGGDNDVRARLNEYLASAVLGRKPASETKEWGKEWKVFALENLKVDDSRGEIRVSLAPNEAARVERISSYHRESALQRGRFRIASIGIAGSNGRLSLTGDQARTQFQENGSGGQEIVYR